MQCCICVEKEFAYAHARYFDGVLECEEKAFACPFVGSHFQNVFAIEQNLAFGYFIARVAGDCKCKRAFAASVGPHYRVDFASLRGERDAFEDFLSVHAGVQVAYFQDSH